MSKDNDFLFTNKPVNKTASKVLSSGEHFESHKKLNQFHSIAPLQTQPFAGPKHLDLSGTKFGRFTVVGCLGGFQRGKGVLWLVKCACSHYETRRTPAIKNPNNQDDCCSYCRQLEFLKHRDRYKQEAEG